VAVGHVHRLGACLAGELVIGDVHVGTDAESVDHDRAARFDGIGMRFAADVDRADLERIDAGACKGVLGRLHRDGDRILIHTGDGFLLNQQAVGDRGRILPPL